MTENPESSDTPISSHDNAGLGIIVAELCEASATVSVEWALARSAEHRGDEDTAMTHMANVTVQLGIIEVQVADIRTAADAALHRLEELTEGTRQAK